MKKPAATMKFTADPKYYNLGDTITIKLENGKIVTYKITSIGKRKDDVTRHIQSYLEPMVERFVLRNHTILLKGLDRIAKEMLKAYLDNNPISEIKGNNTVTVRFIPKVKITKKEV